MKKTSWVLIIFLMVVIMTVGIAYGKNTELFSTVNTDDLQQLQSDNGEFVPPSSALGSWIQQKLKPLQVNVSVDYAAVLLVRADKAAQEQASENSQLAATDNVVRPPKDSSTVKTPDSSSQKPNSEPEDKPASKVNDPEDQDPEPTKPPEEPDPEPENDPEPKPLNPPSGVTATALEKKVIDLVNGARAAEGLNPLTVSGDLIWLARLKSEDLVEHDILSHTSPTYGTVSQMLLDAGISFSAGGENLARCSSVDSAFTLWMGSDGHRGNILKAHFTHTGVGIAYISSSRMVITQIFIQQK